MEQDIEPAEQEIEHNKERQETGQDVEQRAGHYLQQDGEQREAGHELEIEEVVQSVEQGEDLEQDEETIRDKDLSDHEELQDLEAEELDQDGMSIPECEVMM